MFCTLCIINQIYNTQCPCLFQLLLENIRPFDSRSVLIISGFVILAVQQIVKILSTLRNSLIKPENFNLKPRRTLPYLNFDFSSTSFQN